MYSTRNSAQCYVAARMGGEFRGEWIHVYVWLSPFPGHLELSQHSAISQNKVFDFFLMGGHPKLARTLRAATVSNGIWTNGSFNPADPNVTFQSQSMPLN